MVEGFVKNEGTRQLEEVAEEYLTEYSKKVKKAQKLKF